MRIVSIVLFALMLVTVFNCKKDVERGEIVQVVIAQKTITTQRGSTGFNGATSFSDSVESFQTTFTKGGDCETFGQFARLQAGTRKSNKVIFFLDYDLGMDVLPVGDGTAVMYRVNTYRWYRFNGNRWRISINGDDIAEFTNTEAYQAIVGIGMCGNSVKDVTFSPAFLFNGLPPSDILPYGGSRGVVLIDVPNNKVTIK